MKPVVFITGAGRRIGRALALEFGARGYAVAVHYGRSHDGALRTLQQIERAGGSGAIVQGDVRSRQEITRAIDEAYNRLGRIDVLINNAGIYPPAIPLPELEEDLWREVIETNLYGEFFAAQGVARYMVQQGEGGSIVNIASLGAFQIWRDRIPYNVSKAAVVALTRALARSLAPSGITVNAVAPGVISIPEEPAKGALLPPERIPMKRHGTTDDIMRAVWFLATEARYITGQTLLIDGGLNIAQETSQE